MKRRIETKYRLPLLNWSSLPATQIAKTVFGQLDDEKILRSLDFSSFEETFKSMKQSVPPVKEKVNFTKPGWNATFRPLLPLYFSLYSKHIPGFWHMYQVPNCIKSHFMLFSQLEANTPQQRYFGTQLYFEAWATGTKPFAECGYSSKEDHWTPWDSEAIHCTVILYLSLSHDPSSFSFTLSPIEWI